MAIVAKALLENVVKQKEQTFSQTLWNAGLSCKSIIN
jgi:hypothetical protein